MAYPGNSYYQQSSGSAGYPSDNNLQQQQQQRQRQAYLHQIQPGMLQTHYPSTTASQYSYTSSSYPSYTPRSGMPQMSYSMSTASYDNDQSSPTSVFSTRNYSISASSCDHDNDTPSPSSMFPGRGYYDNTPSLSPVSPTTQRQPGDQPVMKSYYCLVEGCSKTTARAACMERHVSNVHFKEQAERIDCTFKGCTRVGKKGFTRKDKMYEHMREVHHCDIPKRRGTASSRPSRAGFDNDPEGLDDPDVYG